jgi:hypothetical protein
MKSTPEKGRQFKIIGNRENKFRAMDQKHLEIFKCGAGGGWKRSIRLIM